jgi:glycerophosphoryl diester phosphodiesterase
VSFYLDRPLNFAHRGASYEAPPNTLVAFLLAVELGADGIEFDAHLSKDGQVVVIHDFDVEATTDGQGLVRDKTLAELQELDAGSRFDPVFAGQRIPTLQEVIDAVGHRLLFNIELKTMGLGDDGLAAAVVRLVEENGLLDRVVVSSFNPLAVWRVKRLNPTIATGLLYCDDMPFYLRRPWLRLLVRPDALHPDYTLVDGEYMRWAKKQGYRVNVWTADDPGEMWRLRRQAVDIIITNRPDLLCEVLRAARGETGQGRGREPTTVPHRG